MKRATEAWQDAELFKAGIGNVAIARFKGNGDAEAGVFLLDVHCLGVKNAFFTLIPAEDYDTFLVRAFPNPRVALSPSCARKLIEAGVAYAHKLGLPPHKDYHLAARVFGGINAGDCQTEFTFGEKGKPLYVQGPHDSPAFARRVLASLKLHCGEGNYHYIMPVDPNFDPSILG
jgi:hypothetical protein